MNCKKEGASGSIDNNSVGELGSSDNNNNNNDDVDDLVKGMNTMDLIDDMLTDYTSNNDTFIISKCAECGKGGDNLKACTSCKSVKYCNAKCRKAHRSKHKKACRQLAAERHNNEMAISDEKLFADPPPKEDCPICMQPIPYAIGMCGVYTMYMPCCGKELCEGCVQAADVEVEKGNMKDCCAFCRKSRTIDEEERLERVHFRLKLNDGGAFSWLGSVMSGGFKDFPQDKNKALKLWHRAADLGSVQAHNSLGSAYEEGEGVEKDVSKGIHYYKLAAMGGHEYARYALGDIEEYNGNMERAMKHYMIAARSGFDRALEEISKGYKAGHVAEDEYTSTLEAHQDSIDEMKSEQRSVAHSLRRLHAPETL